MMKSYSTLKVLGSILACFFFAQPIMADFEDNARKVFTENESSVFGLRALLKISVTMNGKQANAQERPLWSNASVIDDDLLVVSYKSLMPDVGTQGAERPGLEIETEITELKLIDASGEEFDAKLVLHDELLGVAFVALDPEGDNAGEFSAKPLKLAEEATFEHLQELFSIGRMGENMRYQGQLKSGKVTAIVEKPRKLVHVSNISPGGPVFNEAGQVVGLVVVPETQKGAPAIPLLLPSKYITDLVGQAKEKRAEIVEG